MLAGDRSQPTATVFAWLSRCRRCLICHLYGGDRGAKVRLEVRGVVAGDDRGGPAL